MSTIISANVHPNSINDIYIKTFSVIGKQTEIQQIRTIQVPKKAGPVSGSALFGGKFISLLLFWLQESP